jgi:hypothetical protein
LHFVLLFPTGQLGWHPQLEYGSNEHRARVAADDAVDLGEEELPAPGQEPGDPATGNAIRRRGKHRFLSHAEYFHFRLFPRLNESDHLFRAGHLFQEFVVDMWAATQQSRLYWISKNQRTIRADVYQGLVDAVAQADTRSAQLGCHVILPSSFSGSTRNMIQYCQDALAINRHYHGADLFITMTADPNWPEVLAALLPGQTPADRFDLVSRVFHAKVQEFIKDITKGKILGEVQAYVYTIEFQKCNLPHMHMIVFLHPDYKLNTPEKVDSMISAEFPDQDEDPELYGLVKKYMVYGPCGVLNPLHGEWKVWQELSKTT